ncbi:hypothetical protein Pla110_44000 [Polystyrenella longa]|uniref:HD domain-containing protein n=1 Tax=Polystyrenella longa TaxID=2528007 RepID=A0A518CTT6_9PLAN|nr:hypothetical protein [Polystyrenella longa]QDU82639.1 hypothetical protein Pla110_44000 [Polystyrenella longa]
MMVTAVDRCHIITRSGHLVDLFHMQPEDIRLEDVAHSLAMKCRFNGHSPEFYSVAQHSVIVSMNSKFPQAALLHDAAEAYLTDMVRPLKRHFPELIEMETRMLQVIAERFDVPYEEIMSEEVREWDDRVLVAEYEDFFGARPPGMEQVERLGVDSIIPLPPKTAKALFLTKADFLGLS